jgi:hypothetical protein
MAVPVIAFACAAQEHNGMTNTAEAYVAALPDNCIYDDGYVCVEEATAETRFTDEVDESGMVGGNALRAWNVAWTDFQKLPDLSEEQRKLKHYKVGFSRDRGVIIVVLRPLRLPYLEDGKPAGISRGTIGPGVKYWIDQDTFEISKRLFQK